jgi:ribosomal protein L12E/L44/L45/RPP1/RPP2
MSAPDGDRRRSLGKYVKRMSSVFKREKSERSITTAPSAPSAAAPAPSSSAPQAEKKAEQKEEEGKKEGETAA